MARKFNMRLSDEELEVAAIALRAVILPQPNGEVDRSTALGSFYLRRADALVKHIEQFQKDRENGDV